MPITIDYSRVVTPEPTYPGGGSYDGEDYGDACSILVPVDLVGTNSVASITAGGVELREDFTPVWRSDITYAEGDRVHTPNSHRVYESVRELNLNKDPSVLANQFNASGVANYWIDIGPTNRTAMFDGLVSSQTSAPSPLVIALTPGSFNGFALFGIEADFYSVEVRTEPGGSVIYYEPPTALEGTAPADYYEYFFERFKPLKQFIRSGLEPYAGAEITLTLTKGSGDVKLGMFALGDLRPVGIPQRDVSVEPQDFSYFKQDAFGNATVKRRANATGMSITTKMDKADANAVLDTIKEVRGTPVVVVGSEAPEFEWLTVFGLISGRMSAPSYPFATLNITVKGFI